MRRQFCYWGWRSLRAFHRESFVDSGLQENILVTGAGQSSVLR